MSLAALLGDVEMGQAVSLDAEARVEALRRELARAEARAEEQRTTVKKLFSQVPPSHPAFLLIYAAQGLLNFNFIKY